MLARSREASQGHEDTKTYALGDAVLGPFNDAFQRHVFVTTIRLPNMLRAEDHAMSPHRERRRDGAPP